MPLGSRIQAIKGLFAAHANPKPIDDQPKTDTLQPNQPAGETFMATNNVTLTNGIFDPGHTHTLTVNQLPSSASPYGAPYVLPYNQYGGSAVGQLAPGNATYVLPNQYLSYGQAQQNWGVLTAGGLSGITTAGGYTFEPAIPVPSRSEFTEEEIEQAERIMEELNYA